MEHFVLEGNSKKSVPRQGDYARKTAGLLVLFLAARFTGEAKRLKSADPESGLLLWIESGPVCGRQRHLQGRVCNGTLTVRLKFARFWNFFSSSLRVITFRAAADSVLVTCLRGWGWDIICDV